MLQVSCHSLGAQLCLPLSMQKLILGRLQLLLQLLSLLLLHPAMHPPHVTHGKQLKQQHGYKGRFFAS